MRAIALLVVAFLGGAVLVASLVNSRPNAVSASSAPRSLSSTAPVAWVAAQDNGSSAPPAPSGAYTCQGCAGRIEPLREANGVINPRGAHLRTGLPVTLSLQGSGFADVWDCFKASTVRAPWSGQACEASIRW